MSLRKFGTGRVIPEKDEPQRHGEVSQPAREEIRREAARVDKEDED